MCILQAWSTVYVHLSTVTIIYDFDMDFNLSITMCNLTKQTSAILGMVQGGRNCPGTITIVKTVNAPIFGEYLFIKRCTAAKAFVVCHTQSLSA